MPRVKSATFQFKQFSVSHDRCAMKIGTDGVLLGAWADVQDSQQILDVGTGSGVIALMLAQRTYPAATITGIEINEDDAAQAAENVQASPWPGNVNIQTVALQDFQTSQCFDLIVSNPPFFDDSIPPTAARATARHTQTLSFADFLTNTTRLLAPTGKLIVILPFQEGLEFQKLAQQQFRIHTNRRVLVYSKPGKKQERWLLYLSYRSEHHEDQTLYIHDANGGWSEDYQKLTKDFYLKF